VSPDEILSPYTPQDFDPYSYATNDPVNSSDPTGQLPQICDGEDYCGSGGPALYGYGCDASCEASLAPYPVGNFGDLLGGIQNSVLTAVSGVVKVSELMTDPASVITGTPGADAVDKFKNTLTKDEGLDTQSDFYDLGNIGGTVATALVPGAAESDALRVGADATDGLSSESGFSSWLSRVLAPKATAYAHTMPDFSTAPDQAVFWSGIAGGDKTAAAWAAKNGGMTLENVIASRGIVLPPYVRGDPVSMAAWREASEEFARGASGNVSVLQSSAVRSNSIWAEVEWKALVSNPNVSSITAIDPSTGDTSLLWSRP
jgi:hypothetical protein